MTSARRGRKSRDWPLMRGLKWAESGLTGPRSLQNKENKIYRIQSKKYAHFKNLRYGILSGIVPLSPCILTHAHNCHKGGAEIFWLSSLWGILSLLPRVIAAASGPPNRNSQFPPFLPLRTDRIHRLAFGILGSGVWAWGGGGGGIFGLGLAAISLPIAISKVLFASLICP